MTSTDGQAHNYIEQRQPVYMSDENVRSYAVMYNVPLSTNSEIAQEQQIVYNTAPIQYQPLNNTQSYVYPQQLSNNQAVNQYATTCVSDQHYQHNNIPMYTNIPLALTQQPIIHSNMYQQQPSLAACRFASTRYPFSPFTIIFSQEVRKKLVVDELLNHGINNKNFELKMAAYRRGHSENNEHRLLVFVENTESFAFLYNLDNWPSTLAGYQFTIKRSSIPPQLSVVLPSVSLQIDWEDFVQELKSNYSGITDIIRLKNKAQQPVRAVKVEFLSVQERDSLLEAGELSAMHMKFKVIEYFVQAKVLVCSNCYGLGHFRKNCPQKEESTCKTCGEKYQNVKDHQCSGVARCVHCGGAHNSNDLKCKVVKDYRAALTRNLLSSVISDGEEARLLRPTLTNIPASNGISGRPTYASAVRTMPTINEALTKKLDSIITKVEEESSATFNALEELKEEMRLRYEDTKQQVVVLENKVKSIEKKYDDLAGENIHDLAKHMYYVVRPTRFARCQVEGLLGRSN